MKLEYLPDGSSNGHLLRLFDFTPAEAGQFLDVATQLASGFAELVELHRLPFVQPVSGCRLSLVRRTWDQAVIRVGPSEFECAFTAATWDNVAGLVEPFAKDAQGYQWLAGMPGEAAVLLSASGEW